MPALRTSALLAVLLAACGQPAASAPVARAEPVQAPARPAAPAPAPAKPAPAEPLQSTPPDKARPDAALCNRFADHVTDVMAREDPSAKSAAVAMRPAMIDRCVSGTTVAEISCGLAATTSVDMEKCKKG